MTPTLPVTPQTAAPAARVYADGVVVDDPQTATDDYDLNEVERDAGTETIDEDSTPLGNMDLEKDDDHKCCILHFILLLLALIVINFCFLVDFGIIRGECFVVPKFYVKSFTRVLISFSTFFRR